VECSDSISIRGLISLANVDLLGDGDVLIRILGSHKLNEGIRVALSQREEHEAFGILFMSLGKGGVFTGVIRANNLRVPDKDEEEITFA
jgi:hypothetical protein